MLKGTHNNGEKRAGKPTCFLPPALPPSPHTQTIINNTKLFRSVYLSFLLQWTHSAIWWYSYTAWWERKRNPAKTINAVMNNPYCQIHYPQSGSIKLIFIIIVIMMMIIITTIIKTTMIIISNYKINRDWPNVGFTQNSQYGEKGGSRRCPAPG